MNFFKTPALSSRSFLRAACTLAALALPLTAAHAQYPGSGGINHGGSATPSSPPPSSSSQSTRVISEPVSVFPRLAIIEGTAGPMAMTQMILLVQNARKQLTLQKAALVAAYTPGAAAGGTNISQPQFQALQAALQNAQDAAEKVEAGTTKLEAQRSAIPTSTLNSSLSSTASLRAALLGLVQQLKALPRNGTPAQVAAVSATADTVAEMTVFLETLAPTLQKTRDQALLRASDTGVTPPVTTAEAVVPAATPQG